MWKKKPEEIRRCGITNSDVSMSMACPSSIEYYAMLFYHAGGNWYSARLYRSPNHEGVISAVFCICLCDGMYIKVKIMVM